MAKRINRRGGDRGRRPGRADRCDCAGRGRRRDRADRAARRPPDHRTTALLAGSVTALDTLGVWPRLRGAGRAAPGDAHRRRHRAAGPRAGGALRGVRDRARRLRPQHREPASARRARRARARDLPSLTRIEDDVTRGRDRRDRRDDLARRRRARRRAASSSAPTGGTRSAAPRPASRATAASIRRPR